MGHGIVHLILSEGGRAAAGKVDGGLKLYGIAGEASGRCCVAATMKLFVQNMHK
jgi:hypothetical protein